MELGEGKHHCLSLGTEASWWVWFWTTFEFSRKTLGKKKNQTIKWVTASDLFLWQDKRLYGGFIQYHLNSGGWLCLIWYAHKKGRKHSLDENRLAQRQCCLENNSQKVITNAISSKWNNTSAEDLDWFRPPQCFHWWWGCRKIKRDWQDKLRTESYLDNVGLHFEKPTNQTKFSLNTDNILNLGSVTCYTKSSTRMVPQKRIWKFLRFRS